MFISTPSGTQGCFGDKIGSLSKRLSPCSNFYHFACFILVISVVNLSCHFRHLSLCTCAVYTVIAFKSFTVIFPIPLHIHKPLFPVLARSNAFLGQLPLESYVHCAYNWDILFFGPTLGLEL